MIHKPNTLKYRKARKKRKELNRRLKNKRKQGKCAKCKARLNKKPISFNQSVKKQKEKLSKQKRITFLLGAGAVIPWNAPSTKKIDRLVKADRVYKTNSVGIRLGAYLFYKLKKYYDTSEGINFETFIALIEAIHDYYKDSNIQATNPVFQSLTPSILNLFSVEEGNKICIEEFNQAGSDDLVYFFTMWEHYFKIISKRIGEYSDGIQELTETELSKALRKYIEFYQKNNYAVRIYTTNYDRFIPELFKDSQPVFDGFVDRIERDAYFSAFYDPDRIVTDRGCLNYYNLHGSIYWRRTHDKGYSFECTPNLWHEDIDAVSLESVNPGQQILPTRIITGYSKLQRISIEPFNLFMNSFFNDCKQSDEIVTVGYSFGDFHINNILSSKYSKKSKKYIHVSFEDKKNKIPEREIDTFRNISGNSTINPDISDPKWRKYENARIYVKGFEEYLLNEDWKY